MVTAMRIFTNGKVTLLRTGTHVYRWPRKGEASVERRLSKATDYYDDGLLLVDSRGDDLEKAFSDFFHERSLLAADVIDAERAAFLHGNELLTWGPTPMGSGKTVRWERTAALADLSSDFPGWAEEKGLAESRKRKAGFGGGILLANQHGIGVASSASGNVVLFRLKSEEPVLAFRLGTADEDRIYARPIEEGLLVTVVWKGRYSRVFTVSEDGSLLAHLDDEPHGRPPVVDLGKHFVDFVDTTAVVRDRTLAEVATLEVGMSPVAAAGDADGKFFACADSFGGDMVLCSVTKTGKTKEVARINYGDLRRASKKETDKTAGDKAYFLKRVPGTPTIGFAAKPVVSPPWKVRVGAFSLPLIVRSSGGKGKGVAVRLSGPALAGLELERASIGDATASFEADDEGRRAELPDVELLEGVVIPLDPKPRNDNQNAIAEALVRETHLDLVVHGRAKGALCDILKVEIWALGESSAPLKWMRSLQVEE